MSERAPPPVVWVSVCIHCGRPDYAHATVPKPTHGDPEDTPPEKRPQACPYCNEESGKLHRYELVTATAKKRARS